MMSLEDIQSVNSYKRHVARGFENSFHLDSPYENDRKAAVKHFRGKELEAEFDRDIRNEKQLCEIYGLEKHALRMRLSRAGISSVKMLKRKNKFNPKTEYVMWYSLDEVHEILSKAPKDIKSPYTYLSKLLQNPEGLKAALIKYMWMTRELKDIINGVIGDGHGKM